MHEHQYYLIYSCFKEIEADSELLNYRGEKLL